MCVYLLHFDRTYTGNKRNPNAQRVQNVRHYIGYTNNLDQRISAHLRGSGARLVEVLAQAGIGFVVARTWPGAGRTEERKLKNRKNAAQLCPICQVARNDKSRPYINAADIAAIPY
jgi:predicted GIY-YIG superfamily endonuclease